MSPLEIVVIIFAVFVLVMVTSSIIIAKVKGKSTCDCGGDCSCCHGCAKHKKVSEKSDTCENKIR